MTSTDYGDLKVSELVALIKTEYAAITEADRSNLQRALKVGEMLVDLKPRVAKHGEWQLWLRNHCPKISIETANLYMRFANNLEKLEQAAAAKSVTLTDLTITQARELLAKPKPATDDKAKAAKAAVEPAIDPKPASLPPDEVIRELDAGELFDILMVVYQPDDLVQLTTRLAAHLRMTLTPSAAAAA
jgi:hypothetical protein